MIDVLYEDNHLCIVNKPAGLLTQPSGTAQDSLETQVKVWIKEVRQKPGNVFLEAIHRLDKPVSGVVVFAKTSKALSRLNASMRQKETAKTYVALVEGSLNSPQGILEHYLVHDEFQAQVVSKNHPQAKFARLSYKVLKEFSQKSLLEIQLETGRYHQIRVQLAAIGHPIIGDAKYGSRISLEQGIIALHHRQLQIPHPITGDLIVIEAPLPLLFANRQ